MIENLNPVPQRNDNNPIPAIEITIGRHRRDKSWVLKKMTWPELVTRLSKTHRTAESYRDYLAASKDRQDEIKDIGGFVGGVLQGGRRKKDAVLYRTLLTLDIDSMSPQQGARFWGNLQMLYDCAAVLYSTHKHSEDTPRYRLIIPFDQPVTVEAYPAIARRIAGSLGIDQFDPTGFQHERLMYWPSTAKDAEYVYKVQEGRALSSDEVLRGYGPGDRWTDASLWPVCAKERQARERSAKAASDPRTKNGLIGAFCRAYDIDSAIERFLVGIYESAGENRYTYCKGSTSGGMIVYDDGLHTYSHHGTDPTSGRLCNAFDLIRLHRFGHLDDTGGGDLFGDAEVEDVTKLPSYVAMLEFASFDAGVRSLIAQERLDGAREAFGAVDMPDQTDEDNDSYSAPDETADTPDDDLDMDEILGITREPAQAVEIKKDDFEWTKKLDTDRKGNFRSTVSNVMLILENDPGLANKFIADTFREQEVITGRVPWRRPKQHDKWLTDRDISNLRVYLDVTYGIQGSNKINDAFEAVLTRHTLHPVREYLQGLAWDGVPRVEQLLIKYLGAADSPYTRTVTRKMLAAAVTRIMRPGCKFDNCLVLVGEEGKKKSMLLKKLGGKWFSDTFYTFHGKDAYEQLLGYWIIEIGELSALKNAEVETVKLFISKEEDSYRSAFARKKGTRPRQCVFWGTTNTLNFLRGVNGNRRFWPVVIWENLPWGDVARITTEEVGQIWAEAMELFRAGEQLYLEEDMYQQAKLVQEFHTEKDERTSAVQAYLDMEVPENWYDLSLVDRRIYCKGNTDILLPVGTKIRDTICIKEIWMELFEGNLKDLNRQESNVIAEIMVRVKGWIKAKSVIRNKATRSLEMGYIRIDGVEKM